ncbi:hypothetical protein KRR55_00785 [Paeniglutamicibacter sp. ABSL32-1]|uniref:hypothetical protein n=1 Tax=Paeniglutamicibacter quisquiliarum TaxID=2849498 RepID=UPI001C2DAFCD|nr:hypothetical protein [Paeniglutamicibacter quisquiliarum]MBV1777640.1 hypothetical protein [Paeniglutamicibacter quisquiliarum]
MSTVASPPRPPQQIMHPRWLGALQPNRLSAARSFVAKMVRESWDIELLSTDVDASGNGTMVYRIKTPSGTMSFVGFVSEPRSVNRTSRIIGSSWDMLGSLMDGEPDSARIEQNRRELPKLYAGRAPAGTLTWFRANQSVRLFEHVRERLAAGSQPETELVAEVGYLLRNTGLDGNGTFGTRDFRELGPGHPLGAPYHAQMLSAYLMRELSIDLVQHLARLDNHGAATLSPAIRRGIAIGNGSALGLVLFAFNRPQLIGTLIGQYEKALAHALDLPLTADDPAWERLDTLVNRSILYRQQDVGRYVTLPNGPQISSDLRSAKRLIDAARTSGSPRPLRVLEESMNGIFLPETIETIHAIMLELDPTATDGFLFADAVDESLLANGAQAIDALRLDIEKHFDWALDLQLAADHEANRVWYKSRDSEEPRCGPASEVPEGTVDLAFDIPREIQRLLGRIDRDAGFETVGALLVADPTLEQIVAHVQNLADLPYAIPRMDIKDDYLVPVHLIHLLNGFAFGLDKTVDRLERILRGVIFDGAPYRDELGGPEAADWYWAPRHDTYALPVIDAVQWSDK